MYNCIGLMSGTSLDGLDIAYCRFAVENGKTLGFEIVASETIEYTPEIAQMLQRAYHTLAEEYFLMHYTYGKWTGNQVKQFIEKNKLIPPLLVASHGHTVFHRPKEGFTVQIGSGAAIAAECKCPVVCDFRSLDVALGGQGAPLVPMGDHLLFSEYAACVNLGGFANVSLVQNGSRIAYDISVANMALNEYAEMLGKAYDENGHLARTGLVIPQLLNHLNRIDYYRVSPPKSLGREQYMEFYKPLISPEYLPIDVLATLTEHVAFTIANELNQNLPQGGKVLFTGGGCFNRYLMERIQYFAYEQIKCIIPHENLVKYKEALIFALLGLLRWQQLPNTFNTVTGAAADSSGGCIYFYKK